MFKVRDTSKRQQTQPGQVLIKLRRSLLVLGLGWGLVLVVLGVLADCLPDLVRAESPAHFIPMASIRYVSSVRGVDAGDCTAPSTPCATIQYAADQATAGDEIRIASLDNTTFTRYTGSGDDPVIMLNKSLTLCGGYLVAGPGVWALGSPPAPVDGEHARRPLYVSGAVSVTLELLSFINGQADQGGNVYAEDAALRFIATPVLSGAATYGGGLYLKNSQASFDPDTLRGGDLPWLSGLLLIQGNTAQYGGGLYVERGEPTLTGLTIYSNTATIDGGGLYLQGGQPVIGGAIVRENRAGSRGGGLFVESSSVRIATTRVYSNIAVDGAGFYLENPGLLSVGREPIIANNYIRYNHASGGQGGGLYLHQVSAKLINNVIADNQANNGAALYLWASSPLLYYNTIAQNVGATGLYLTHEPGSALPPTLPDPSRPVFTNTIIATHTTGIYVDSTDLPGLFQNEARLAGTLWWGNETDATGLGDISRTGDVIGSPHFTCVGVLPRCVNPYHLLSDSAAVDTGVAATLTVSDTNLFVDIDGQLRPAGAGFDIGADEVVSYTFDVRIVPSLSTLSVEPGQSVTHTHLLINSGVDTDTYDLTFTSDLGWATFLGKSTITLTAQTSTTLQVRVSAPPTATVGMRETAIITAVSQAVLENRAIAVDVTNVVASVKNDLVLAKWANLRTVQPGGIVSYTFIITNAGPLTTTSVATLTDTFVPTQAIQSWNLPTGCIGNIDAGLVNCILILPVGTLPLAASLSFTLTTSNTYTGPLVNTAMVGATASDPTPANNTAEVVVGITFIHQLYLPVVLKN